MLRRTTFAILVLGTITGCIPYTVGTTALPLKPGERSSTLSTFVMPGVGHLNSSEAPATSHIASDFEYRLGLDDRSDVGIRTTSATGLVMNYKHLLTGPDNVVNVAVMPGAGFVNMGDHAYFELTLIASGSEPRHDSSSGGDTLRSIMVPYGGLRLMQVAPIAQGAVTDLPTIGAFFGVRLGDRDMGISPEIGVFYDHSALGLRRGDLVIVPAISVHGDRLMRAIRGGGRPIAAAVAGW